MGLLSRAKLSAKPWQNTANFEQPQEGQAQGSKDVARTKPKQDRKPFLERSISSQE